MPNDRSFLLILTLLAASCGGDDDGPSPDGGMPADDSGADASVVDEAAELFEPDRLLEIEIELDPDDWEVLRHQHLGGSSFVDSCPQSAPLDSPYTEFPATIRVDGETVEDVSVRKKGFLGSVTPARPSLKIQFDEYVPDRKFHGLTRLTLNNNRQDPSQANTCLAYRVFREAGVPAPRCNHARVTVNGQYLGVYSHVESIRKSFLEQHFDDGDGTLYEGAISDFRATWVDSYENKKGQDVDSGTPEDRSDLAAMVDALASEDADVLERLEPLLDLEAFYTFWAAELLVGHWDGYTGDQNNHYVYRDTKTGRFHFIPWGPDSSFGPPNLFLSFTPPASLWGGSILPNRLYATPEARARYQTRLQELLDQVWDEDALEAEVDRIEAMLAPHVTVGPEVFAADLDRIRSFIRAQRRRIEEDLARDPEWPVPMRASPCFRSIGHVTATFSCPFGPFPAANPFADATATIDLTLDGEPVEYAQIGATAGPFRDEADPSIGIGVLGLRSNFTILGPLILMDPDLYAPGTHEVELYDVFGALLSGDGVTFAPTAFGQGTLTLDEAGATDGAIVSGSLEMELYWQ